MEDMWRSAVATIPFVQVRDFARVCSDRTALKVVILGLLLPPCLLVMLKGTQETLFGLHPPLFREMWTQMTLLGLNPLIFVA